MQVEREAQEALNAQQWQEQQQQEQQQGGGAPAQQSYSGSESYGPAGGWSQEEGYGSSGRY